MFIKREIEILAFEIFQLEEETTETLCLETKESLVDEVACLKAQLEELKLCLT